MGAKLRNNIKQQSRRHNPTNNGERKLHFCLFICGLNYALSISFPIYRRMIG
jgi:hypothetical protein